MELKICGKAIALNYSRFNGEGSARERMGKMNINIPIMRLGQYCAGLGITRCLLSLAESDAIKSVTLSEKEKEIYFLYGSVNLDFCDIFTDTKTFGYFRIF